MSNHSKWGLRNANDFLNVLRRKYTRDHEESTLLHNKTFFEEESLELYDEALKQPNLTHSPDCPKSPQEEPIETLSQIKPPPRPQNTFCERLITRNLEETLHIYERDLEILIENKAFLQEKIELLGQKIRKLRELQSSNKILAQENEAAKQFLVELVQEYHHSCSLLFHSRLQQQEAFNSARNKVRMLMRETNEDYHFIGFTEQWNAHIATLLLHKTQIKARVAQEKALKEQENKQEERKKQEVKVKIVPVPAQKDKGKGQDDDYLAPDEPKPKKRMSQSEKASLLGDLKSFAKNFKFPSG